MCIRRKKLICMCFCSAQLGSRMWESYICKCPIRTNLAAPEKLHLTGKSLQYHVSRAHYQSIVSIKADFAYLQLTPKAIIDRRACSVWCMGYACSCRGQVYNVGPTEMCINLMLTQTICDNLPNPFNALLIRDIDNTKRQLKGSWQLACYVHNNVLMRCSVHQNSQYSPHVCPTVIQRRNDVVWAVGWYYIVYLVKYTKDEM